MSDLFGDDIFAEISPVSPTKTSEKSSFQIKTKTKIIPKLTNWANFEKVDLDKELAKINQQIDQRIETGKSKKSEELEKLELEKSEKLEEKATENIENIENIAIINIKSHFNLNTKAKILIEKVNWATTQRKTELVDEILKLTNHSSVAVRRKIAESVAQIGNKEIIPKLANWHQKESDRQTLILIQTSIDKLGRRDDFEFGKHILTVSEALITVKTLLGKQSYQIEGELSEVRNFGNMIYFGLKDKQDSRLDCICFSGILSRCQVVMNEGWSVRITGKFKLGKFSKISLDVSHIELTGQGALLQNLKNLEEKLTKEGLFDITRKRKINNLPTRILLIASSNSAALTDFVKVLSARRTGITIFHQNIKTQGIGAESEIIQVLERTNDLIDLYAIDTVVMTRGGGSMDDLFVFNSEKIIRNLHGIKVPTIVAIGHERDTTLAERVADLRASTPSNAAELVSFSNFEIENKIREVDTFCQNYLVEKTIQYQNLVQKLIQMINNSIQKEIQNTSQICQKTDNLIFEIINNLRKKLDYNDILAGQIFQDINLKKQQAQTLWQRIIDQRERQILEISTQVQFLDCQLEIENPKKILAKGYAIIKQNDQIITKINAIQTGKITIEMIDGQKEINT